ncbi:carboxypeptidase Taq [Strigomonas culicis]|nr:carboxypeptidase Taq [Strigomonas culicis]|eukprot:EPY25743.1 carboxypeptidase Taq [Strigomonas culicis]
MRLQDLDDLFRDVLTWLPALLQEILKKQATLPPVVPVETPVPQAKQQALCEHFMKVWQFDLEAGRLDVSPHPFTGMTKEDVRITTNYNVNNLEQSLYAVIHETGHAKYEQNCGPRDFLGQPVCNARSLGVHESQSLFAEKQVARSGAFMAFLTPLLRQYIGEQPAFASEENVKRLMQTVDPGFIRVNADEVCYPLHIILRYEMERALVEGTMEAEDVPRVWNEKMKQYLGLDPGDRDDLGCLQDIHWSGGAFGYFPTYTLGSMFAAQLMATIRRELGEAEVARCIAAGELAPIFAQQKAKIWDQGCLYETEDLMRRATGEKLNPKYFREHLERRYLRRED